MVINDRFCVECRSIFDGRAIRCRREQRTPNCPCKSKRVPFEWIVLFRCWWVHSWCCCSFRLFDISFWNVANKSSKLKMYFKGFGHKKGYKCFLFFRFSLKIWNKKTALKMFMVYILKYFFLYFVYRKRRCLLLVKIPKISLFLWLINRTYLFWNGLYSK